MKKFFGEFRQFINKGNVIDLAVAVIIGAAFGKIVSSLVDDIITPLTSLIIGSKDLADWKSVIIPSTETAAEVAIYYGRFLKNILDFLIVAFSIFLVVRFYNRAKANFQKQLADGGTKIRGFFGGKNDEKNKNADDGAEKNDENGNEISVAPIDAKDGESGNENETNAAAGIKTDEKAEIQKSDNSDKKEEKTDGEQDGNANLLKEIRDLLTARLGKK